MRIVAFMLALFAFWPQPASAGVTFSGSGLGTLFTQPSICHINYQAPECMSGTGTTTTALYSVFVKADSIFTSNGGISFGQYISGCIFDLCYFSSDAAGNFILSSSIGHSYLSDSFHLSGTGSYGTQENEILSINVSAVPEPSTWVMMLLGFSGIGFAMRRRRVTALQAA